MRVFLAASAIWLASGLTAAYAASCEDYCVKTRCAPGNVSYNQSICVTKCMAACNSKHKK
jgi:hypothetical protein